MQQQNPQEQCGNPPQLQQSVMICPVQYVYEAPVILPQPQRQEEQIQRNQILINVKNTPPWIQNRTQNQVVYMQQLPNNYQPYIHPQMVQNPIYHPQMTYQIQPMLAQDNRQFIQIPNINQYNTVQNPTAQVSNAEPERMPLLTQMLNQRAAANRALNNVVRPIITPAVNPIRPIMHNQQVQTDNVSPNIKGRPRNVPPQIITINPMQQQQLANQKQALMNVRPTNMRNDVPQHIRTKIPSSISVKSINRPLLPRSLVRPLDVMPAPQNFYYNPIMMPAPNTDTKNIMTNTASQFNTKPNNFQETHATTTVPMQYPIISNVPHFVNVATQKNFGDTQKPKLNISATVKPNANPVKMLDNNDKNQVTEKCAVKDTESQTQTEEKLIRNTVYVQARGRVLNDKEITQNQSLKRTVDDRIKEETNQIQEASNAARSQEEAIQFSKKIKVEINDNSSEIGKAVVNSPAAKLPMNIQTQQSRISNLLVNADNVQKTSFKTQPQPKKSNQVSEDLHVIKSEESKPAREDKVLKQSNSPEVSKCKEQMSLSKENKNSDEIKEFKNISNNEVSVKVKTNSVLEEEIKEEDSLVKEETITVLTHVLDGYIIQESNVAFPIQRPMMEREIREQASNQAKSQDQNKLAKMSKKEESSDENTHTNENKGHFSWRNLNKAIESEKEMELSVIDKDNPFAKTKKSTVESWTPDQLASHLEKYKWTETATKLLDEEIDGESILLVNKDQLVAIGVCEEHAETIVAFAAS